MPPRFTIGDTLAFTKTLAAYPASAGWVLHYRLVPRGITGSAQTFYGTASGDSHVIDVPAATTAAWQPATYTWASWVTDGTDSHTLEAGSTQLLINPRTTAAPLDLRSDAQIALDNVRAVIQGKASADVYSYTIAGRSLQRYAMAELVALESRLVSQVRAEQRAAAIAAGRPDPRKIHVRLGRA
jgi:hypothetical protein